MAKVGYETKRENPLILSFLARCDQVNAEAIVRIRDYYKIHRESNTPVPEEALYRAFFRMAKAANDEAYKVLSALENNVDPEEGELFK